MTEPAEKRACKDGETICGQTLTSYVDICQVCGAAVPPDMAFCPEFGFVVACPLDEKAEDE